MDVVWDIFDKVKGALSSFNFTSDLLDVLLVAFIIYEAIKIIRGSRTVQLVKGIVVLIVLFAVVNFLNMEASEYLLSLLIQNGLLILVILFAPELRSALERFGRQSLKDVFNIGFRNKNEHDKVVVDMINGFCRAADDMSSTQTGALVVFEKASILKDVAETGTIVDAKASAELFNGLFFKNSALHDGAVIVRDGRIFAAGCILPLTQNTALASELGTRHRSAIGMTEHTDALVVVVSEENGIISVAKDGQLQRDVTTGKLREILLGELVDSADKKNDKSNKKSRKEKKNEK